MIRKLFGLFLIVILITVYFTTPVFADDRERASVLDFSSGGDVENEYKIAATNKLTKMMFIFKKFDMIERTEIDRILAEQKFQNTGLVDQQKAVEIGKLLNIDYAFIGHIDHLSTVYNKPNYNASAKITVKIIDVRSGKLLHIVEIDGNCTNSIEQTSLLGALDGCFSDRLLFELRNTFAPLSSIFKVENNYIYIANGENIGIKNGIRYRILRPDKTSDSKLNMTDTFTTEIGFAEVVQVTDTKSKARIISKNAAVTVEDLVQELFGDEPLNVQKPVEPQQVQPEDKTKDTEVPTVPESEKENPPKTEPQKKTKNTSQNGGAWVDSVIMRTGEEAFDQNGYYNYESSVVFEDRIGYEWQSFGTSLGIDFGIGGSQSLTIYNIGLVIGQDIPLIRNFLHLTCSGTAGWAFGSGYDEYYNLLTEESLYLTGAVGARMFLGGFRGIRLQYDLLYSLGPVFYNCDCSGLGMRFMIGFCL